MSGTSPKQIERAGGFTSTPARSIYYTTDFPARQYLQAKSAQHLTFRRISANMNVRHKFIIFRHGSTMRFCTSYFSVSEEFVSQQSEVHFRGVLCSARHTFFMPEKGEHL